MNERRTQLGTDAEVVWKGHALSKNGALCEVRVIYQEYVLHISEATASFYTSQGVYSRLNVHIVLHKTLDTSSHELWGESKAFLVISLSYGWPFLFIEMLVHLNDCDNVDKRSASFVHFFVSYSTNMMKKERKTTVILILLVFWQVIILVLSSHFPSYPSDVPLGPQRSLLQPFDCLCVCVLV